MSTYCHLCEYSAKNLSNFINHKKTKKHIEKSKNVPNSITELIPSVNEISKNDTKKSAINFICELCNKSFKQKNNYYRHRKSCKNSKISNDKELLEKDYQLKLEKEKLELQKEQSELLKELLREKTELLNNFMNSANKIINKEQDNNKVTTDALKSVSMSALKYANEKFKNTPALLPLDNFNLNDLDFDDENDKKKLVEILIYNAKQNSLDKLLGDHIVKEYKKENPEEQPFHTTDCSRLNYIVRELIETALIWSTDKSGIKICTSIIKPLIKKCINALLEHQKYLLQEMGRGEYQVQKDVEVIINVLMTIESGNLETEINKYIAPFFNLDKK